MFVKRDYGDRENPKEWKRKEDKKGRGDSGKWGQVRLDVVLKRGWYDIWVGCFENSNFFKLNKMKYISGCRFFLFVYCSCLKFKILIWRGYKNW